MQSDNSDNVQLSLKTKAGILSGLVLAGFIALGLLLYPQYQAAQKAAAMQVTAKPVKIKDVPIKTKKRSKKMVQIVAGNSGQADVKSGVDTCQAAAAPDDADVVMWELQGDLGVVASNQIVGYGGPGAGYSGEPGWVIEPDGAVTVPSGATAGNYTITYYPGESCTLSGEDYARAVDTYEFQVITGDPGPPTVRRRMRVSG